MPISKIIRNVPFLWNNTKDSYTLHQVPDMAIAMLAMSVLGAVAWVKIIFTDSFVHFTTSLNTIKLFLMCIFIPVFIVGSVCYIYKICTCPSKLIIDKKGIHYYESGLVLGTTREPKPYTWHTYHWNSIHSFYFDTDSGDYPKGIPRRTIVLNMLVGKNGRITKKELQLRHFHFNCFNMRKAIEFYSDGKCKINREEQLKIRKQELIIVITVIAAAIFALVGIVKHI